jgi:4-hydroxy-tetrahydrodipicolinate reductase
MGRTVASAIASRDGYRVVAGVDPARNDATNSTFPVYPAPSDVAEDADVVIDFSHPSGLTALLDVAVDRSWGVVIATTGLGDDHQAAIDGAARAIPVLQAANMSLGINVLRILIKQARAMLGDTFDIEIIEKHHRMKKDAPSGTALALARELSGVDDSPFVFGREGEAPRKDGEIGVLAVRGGTIVGEHDVVFAGTDEVLTLRHTAYSRSLFAAGALKAAAFIASARPGVYSMDDVLTSDM